MLRALSTRNGQGNGYEKLIKEEYGSSGSSAPVDPKLTRANTVGAKVLFGPSFKDLAEERVGNEQAEPKSVEKKAKKKAKIYPLFNFFHPRLTKKATSKPEFSRYLNYLKEGGVLPTTTAN